MSHLAIYRRTRQYLAACAGVLMASAAMAADRVTLATATPGGGFPAYGAVFAQTVNQTDPTLQVEPLNTRGSTENIRLLETGKTDIGLVQGEVAHAAFTGHPPSKARIIAAMYATPGMFVVRAGQPEHHIRDLIGKPVVFGARGSGLVILGRYVLAGMGLDMDRDFQAIYLEHAGDGPAMVADGRAAALWGGGLGWPGFTRVAQLPGGARFITPSAQEIGRILAQYPYMRQLTVPAGVYPGQDQPLTSVGSWSFVMARPDLPNAVAYRLARALDHGQALLAKLPQARETTLAHTIAAAPDPSFLHPGVRRYLLETGRGARPQGSHGE